MFKLVFVFGLILASASDENTSNFELSKHAELSMNQTNETVTESTVTPITDSLETEQQKQPNHHDERTQQGNERFTRFWKWSLTKNSCAPSSKRSAKSPYREDFTMSLSISVQGKKDSDENKSEKTVEVERPHPRKKREGTSTPKNNLEMDSLDDWMENKAKVPHISHIYIGESMYPYMYEESRVIQSEASKPSSGVDPRLKAVKITQTRPKKEKEEEVPVYEITKIYEIK